ncbi:AHH domain-containing protein [Sphingopyxis terrae]|uniref:AHH domain-containing protein n=1 Tax=Sphingopyxis terrae TaxID=33052 RepID=UPI002A0B919E|nr:AHH domain-containing protein [Sphingopyxis terrae]MDX8358581.1 AHH domain-containing protein [Sphingopyxis terrae]
MDIDGTARIVRSAFGRVWPQSLMAGRRWYGAPPPRRGFQRHHLIPLALLAQPQIAAMFGALKSEGFCLSDFPRNGLSLPACERLALSCGHALHRGPHHGYNDVVTARVDMIRICFERQINRDARAARRTAAMRLTLLQDTMRRALTDRHGAGFWLNRRDPMRLFADRPYLDEAITRLFG